MLAALAAAVVVLAALAVAARLAHKPSALSRPAHSAVGSGSTSPFGSGSTSGAVIRFSSGQGIILTSAGSRYRLTAEVLAAHGHRKLAEEVRWRSDNPAEVSVSPDGTATAHVAVGSANITATAAGAQPQVAQVLVAQPALGTLLVPTGDIVSADAGNVVLRRTPGTAAIAAGNILVSNGLAGGGLLARVISVSTGASSVTVVTHPASLASAFRALSVNAVSAPVTAAVPASAIHTTAAPIVKCTRDSGVGEQVSLQSPDASVRATVRVYAELHSQAGVVQKLTLKALATVAVTVHTGALMLTAAGQAHVTCELGVTGIPVPTPAFLGPVEIVGQVGEQEGVDASLDVSGAVTLPGPIISATITGADGIQYTQAGGWQPIQQNQPAVTMTPGAPATSHTSLSASMSSFAQVDIGVAGMLAGDQLAGTSLAFTKAQVDYALSLQSPFSYLTPGYTGPGWHTSAGVTAGPEISLTGNLATLLQWAGLNPPSLTWTPVNIALPGPASPTVTVTASPGSAGSAGSKSILLSASLPSRFNRDKVEFIQYPPGGGPGSLVATGTVSGTTAAGTWRNATPATGARITALVFDGPYGLANLPYASASSPAPSLTPTNWRQVSTLTDPTANPTESIAISPTGGTLATGHGDGSSYLWNMASGQLIATITPPDPNNFSAGDDVRSLAFSPDGKTLAAGLGNGMIVLRDVATLQTIAAFDDGFGRGAVSSLAFSPDGKTLAAADLGGRGTFLWDVATGHKLALLSAGLGAVTSAAFSSDGKTLATGGDDGTALWDVATGRAIARFGIAGSGPIIAVAFSPDGSLLATGGFNGAVLWDVSSRHETAFLASPAPLADTTSVAFSPDGALLATTGVRTPLWATATGAKITILPVTADSIAFSPHGQTLATTSGHRVILWTPAT